MKIFMRKKGFTLMEMLIVVAIIAILVVIAIPVFSAQLEKSRAAVCTANRRSLLSVCYAAAMTADAQAGDISDTALQTAFQQDYTNDAAAKENYICPSGGTYSWANGYIECSKHGAGGGGFTIGGNTYTLTATVTTLSGTQTAAGKKGSVFKVGDKYYALLSDYTYLDTALITTGGTAAEINLADAPLTIANEQELAPKGSLYADDSGNIYVKLSGGYCTNLPTGASNDVWQLIGKAA